MSSLHLYQRPAEGDGYVMRLTNLAKKWERKILATGGFWSGSFELPEVDGLTWFGLQDFYNRYLGCRLVERTFGLTSWEGFIYEMRLVRAGQEYRRTLSPDWWHNKVKAVYSYPSSDDSEQANLAYNPAANSFQDDGQDFGEWETLAGDATFSLTVTNADGTIGWGFLGAAFTTANADDSIYVYTDVELGTAGWNGETGVAPSTYEVRNVTLAGARQDTGWSEDTDSSDVYGTMEYVLSLGGAVPEGAQAIRDRELAELAWPRSRKMGGGQVGTGVRNSDTVLEVSVAGFWTTLNWIYRDTARVAAASDMISTLVAASEFVTARRVETNELAVKADCDPIPQRLGDLCEITILQGDIDKNPWQGGVYEDREFIYEQAPAEVGYYLRADGTLVQTGGRPVTALALFRPGVLLKDQRAPVGGGQPAGGAVRDDPQIAYIEEVEWRADDNELRYRLLGQEQSVTVLREQLKTGAFVASEF